MWTLSYCYFRETTYKGLVQLINFSNETIGYCPKISVCIVLQAANYVISRNRNKLQRAKISFNVISGRQNLRSTHATNPNTQQLDLIRADCKCDYRISKPEVVTS